MMESRVRRWWRAAIAAVVVVVVIAVVSGCPTGLGPGNGTGPNTDTVIYEVGGPGPAGGIVFYDKGAYSDGWRYLEAWTADEEGTHRWKVNEFSTTGTSTSVGSGYANTYTHTAESVSAHPAAEVVRSATHGGHNDWFLPSKDELYQMYLQRESIGDFVVSYYWSSSQSATKNAWAQGFSIGNSSGANKYDNQFRVRAVRAF